MPAPDGMHFDRSLIVNLEIRIGVQPEGNTIPKKGHPTKRLWGLRVLPYPGFLLSPRKTSKRFEDIFIRWGVDTFQWHGREFCPWKLI